MEIGGMGRLDFVIDDELEMKLRMKALTEHGGKKGSLVVTLQEAIAKYVGEEPEAAQVKVLMDKGSSRTAKLRAAKTIAETGRGFPVLAKVFREGNLDLLDKEFVLAAMAEGSAPERKFLEYWSNWIDEERRKEAHGRKAGSQASRAGDS